MVESLNISSSKWGDKRAVWKHKIILISMDDVSRLSCNALIEKVTVWVGLLLSRLGCNALIEKVTVCVGLLVSKLGCNAPIEKVYSCVNGITCVHPMRHPMLIVLINIVVVLLCFDWSNGPLSALCWLSCYGVMLEDYAVMPQALCGQQQFPQAYSS